MTGRSCFHGSRPRVTHGRRLVTKGRRADGSFCTLLFVHEADGAWTIHLDDAPGVTLPRLDMLALAEAIVERAGPW